MAQVAFRCTLDPASTDKELLAAVNAQRAEHYHTEADCAKCDRRLCVIDRRITDLPRVLVGKNGNGCCRWCGRALTKAAEALIPLDGFLRFLDAPARECAMENVRMLGQV